MSKRICSSDFYEGLKLCEQNGLDFYLASREKSNNREYRSAYLFGIISFEEFVKAHMILDSYNDEYISGNKWDDKMTQHRPKLMYGAEMLDNALKESTLRAIGLGALPSNIKINLNTGFTEKFVDNILKNRISYVYVDYSPEKKMWIPITNEFKPGEIYEIINASASLWVILSNRKDKLNIETIPLGQIGAYFK